MRIPGWAILCPGCFRVSGSSLRAAAAEVASRRFVEDSTVAVLHTVQVAEGGKRLRPATGRRRIVRAANDVHGRRDDSRPRAARSAGTGFADDGSARQVALRAMSFQALADGLLGVLPPLDRAVAAFANWCGLRTGMGTPLLETPRLSLAAVRSLEPQAPAAGATTTLPLEEEPTGPPRCPAESARPSRA